VDEMTCKAMDKATPFGKLVDIKCRAIHARSIEVIRKQGVVLKRGLTAFFWVKGGRSTCAKKACFP
ncbi:MAG: hypothetical protein ACOY0R_07200, partial [Chloroflexota bacterium]